MPETAPHPPAAHSGGGPSISRKLGPLPLYAWAGLAVVAFLLYRHFHGSGSSLATTGGSTAVPLGDQSGSGLSDLGSGGLGSATLPDVIVNNYLPGPTPDTTGATSTPGGSTSTSPTGTSSTAPASSAGPSSSEQVVGPASTVTSGAGVTSTRPAGTISPGGAITGRGIRGGY